MSFIWFSAKPKKKKKIHTETFILQNFYQGDKKKFMLHVLLKRMLHIDTHYCMTKRDVFSIFCIEILLF